MVVAAKVTLSEMDVFISWPEQQIHSSPNDIMQMYQKP